MLSEDEPLDVVLEEKGWPREALALLRGAPKWAHTDTAQHFIRLLSEAERHSDGITVWTRLREFAPSQHSLTNTLARNGLVRVGEVLLYSYDELLYLFRMGSKRADTIKGLLTAAGFALSSPHDPILDRFERVFGGLTVAPAGSVIVLDDLLSNERYTAGLLRDYGYSTFQHFVQRAGIETVAQLLETPQTELDAFASTSYPPRDGMLKAAIECLSLVGFSA